MSPDPAASEPVSAAIDPLGSTVRALFCDLRHAGEARDHAGEVRETGGPGRLLCGEAGQARQGTQVRFSLRMSGRRVVEARYRVYGCPYTLATCEWLARRLQDCELPECSPAGLAAVLGGPADWAGCLAVPADRLGRLLVLEDALHAAVAAGDAR